MNALSLNTDCSQIPVCISFVEHTVLKAPSVDVCECKPFVRWMSTLRRWNNVPVLHNNSLYLRNIEKWLVCYYKWHVNNILIMCVYIYFNSCFFYYQTIFIMMTYVHLRPIIVLRTEEHSVIVMCWFTISPQYRVVFSFPVCRY